MSPLQYLAGSFKGSERRLILAAALVLLPVFFLPVLPLWHLRMVAPQYREGLNLHIYTNTIKGDVAKINTLNHYVGMKAISADDFREFTYMPQLLTLFGLTALIAALVGRRWIAVVGWLAFTAFAVYMFRDYVLWLYRYGHDLDPRAAIKLGVFMPPIVGYQKMANFQVWSYPGLGTWLLGLAWFLGPFVLWLDRRVEIRKTRAAVLAGSAVLLIAAAVPAPAQASVLRALPGEAGRTIETASPGDTILLARGIHEGPLRIDRRLVLRGEPGVVIDGRGRGTVLTVAADGASVADLEIRGSGKRVLTVDSGMHVIRARKVRVERVRMQDVLYGIYAERADSLVVRNCDLAGRVRPLDETGEGNGIHLWYCGDVALGANHISGFLDAIYLSFADRIEVTDNAVGPNGRYGLHTMYCQRNRLAGNQFRHNAAGIAIMFSNRLLVERNLIARNRGPRTYGLLLRDCSDGTFVDNRLVDNTVALFLDGSNRNRFSGNLLQDNGWGVLLFASCADNVWAGNDFIQNDYAVALDMRRTRNRFDDGARGNYWSDAETYDLDGNGVGDVPFGPVTAFAFVSKQYPDLSVLAKSPAVAALGVAERVFPSLRPSQAVDRFPLTSPARGRAGGEAGRAALVRSKPSWAHVALFLVLWGFAWTAVAAGAIRR